MLLFRLLPYAIVGLFERGDDIETQFWPFVCTTGPGEYALGVVGARLCPLAVGEAIGDRYMALLGDVGIVIVGVHALTATSFALS